MQLPVDYNRVEPIPERKTVALINNFVINTTQFLNKFSFLCEQKLQNVSTKIERLEISMSLLEAKLNSIPDLKELTDAQEGGGQEGGGQEGGEDLNNNNHGGGLMEEPSESEEYSEEEWSQ